MICGCYKEIYQRNEFMNYQPILRIRGRDIITANRVIFNERFLIARNSHDKTSFGAIEVGINEILQKRNIYGKYDLHCIECDGIILAGKDLVEVCHLIKHSSEVDQDLQHKFSEVLISSQDYSRGS